MKAFSLQEVVKIVEGSGSPLVRGQVNTADEAKLRSTIGSVLKCWLYDVQLMLSWKRIGPILLTDAGCRHCSFWYITSIY